MHWKNIKIQNPKDLPTWDLIKNFVKNKGKILEIGPGFRPKIPVKGSYFLDYSTECVNKLNDLSGKGLVFDVENSIPYPDKFFDLVCSFETLEHIKNDEMLVAEVYRVLKKDGYFVIGVPASMKLWSKWDDFAGHKRRYEMSELKSLIKSNGFTIKKIYTFDHPMSIFQKTFVYKALAYITVFTVSKFSWLISFGDNYVYPIMSRMSLFATKSNGLKECKGNEDNLSNISIIAQKKGRK